MAGAVRRRRRDVAQWVLAPVRVLMGVLILASIAISFANVVGRYVFFRPLPWAEEVMTFIMVWCVFLGAVLVTWDGRHLRMDVFSTSIPRPWSTLLNAVGAVGFVVIALFVAAQSYEVVSLFSALGQVSTVAGIPKAIPHAAVGLGFALMAAAVVARLRLYLTGGPHDEGGAGSAGHPGEGAHGSE